MDAHGMVFWEASIYSFHLVCLIIQIIILLSISCLWTSYCQHDGLAFSRAALTALPSQSGIEIDLPWWIRSNIACLVFGPYINVLDKDVPKATAIGTASFQLRARETTDRGGYVAASAKTSIDWFWKYIGKMVFCSVVNWGIGNVWKQTLTTTKDCHKLVAISRTRTIWEMVLILTWWSWLPNRMP